MVLSIVLSVFKINGANNSNVVLKPNYDEFWIQQMMPPLAIAFICFSVLLKKVKLRKFIFKELGLQCSLPNWINVIE
jgi:hypothetical protein